MNAIGGYFELELPRGEEYHKNAIRLNTGRNAFEYVLRAKRYQKVYLPFYTCDVMLEPIKKLNIDYSFYSIDKDFRPVFNYNDIEENAAFVYTNYFGLCEKIVKEVSEQCKNLIIDNSQAFFTKPLPNVDTFYSSRKFFGVPDGAYLYTNKRINENFETDISYKRFEHLLGRADRGAEEFYATFKNNDDALINQPIKLMSKLTQKLLSGIDYKTIAEIRKENFNFLHTQLKNINQLDFTLESDTTPMLYPFLVKNGDELKKNLIKNSIFIPTYWPNVLKWCNKGYEKELVQTLVCLPTDQRYSLSDINQILECYGIQN